MAREGKLRRHCVSVEVSEQSPHCVLLDNVDHGLVFTKHPSFMATLTRVAMGTISDVLTGEVKVRGISFLKGPCRTGIQCFQTLLRGRVLGLWELGLGPGALLRIHMSDNCFFLETTLAIDWGFQSNLLQQLLVSSPKENCIGARSPQEEIFLQSLLN